MYQHAVFSGDEKSITWVSKIIPIIDTRISAILYQGQQATIVPKSPHSSRSSLSRSFRQRMPHLMVKSSTQTSSPSRNTFVSFKKAPVEIIQVRIQSFQDWLSLIVHTVVTVSYSFSPIMFQVEEYRRGYLMLLTNLCAIVGGIFTVVYCILSNFLSLSIYFL